MRLRNIPGAEEEVAMSPYCITTPQEYKGHWAEVFKNDNIKRRDKIRLENFIKTPKTNIYTVQKKS